MKLDRGSKCSINVPIRKIRWCCSVETNFLNGFELIAEDGSVIQTVGFFKTGIAGLNNHICHIGEDELFIGFKAIQYPTQQYQYYDV